MATLDRLICLLFLFKRDPDTAYVDDAKINAVKKKKYSHQLHSIEQRGYESFFLLNCLNTYSPTCGN